MRLFLAGLIGATFSMNVTANANTPDPIALYGETIDFDVFRDDSKVGAHQTRFERQGDTIAVISNMDMAVSAFFVPVYSFSYQSEEIWNQNGLNQLDVNVQDGGENNQIEARLQDETLQILMNGENSDEAMRPILTSNHWNMDILEDNQVINTLTGNVNQFELIARGEEKVEAKCKDLMAKRYDYEGELRDTSVWYDNEGRWVRLQFKARDGSQITYRLNNCDQEPS